MRHNRSLELSPLTYVYMGRGDSPLPYPCFEFATFTSTVHSPKKLANRNPSAITELKTRGIDMNWEVVAAISEAAAALGVIATLVYLTIQVRQSKEATEANTRQMRGQAFFQLYEGLKVLTQTLMLLRS